MIAYESFNEGDIAKSFEIIKNLENENIYDQKKIKENVIKLIIKKLLNNGDIENFKIFISLINLSDISLRSDIISSLLGANFIFEAYDLISMSDNLVSNFLIRNFFIEIIKKSLQKDEVEFAMKIMNNNSLEEGSNYQARALVAKYLLKKNLVEDAIKEIRKIPDRCLYDTSIKFNMLKNICIYYIKNNRFEDAINLAYTIADTNVKKSTFQIIVDVLINLKKYEQAFELINSINGSSTLYKLVKEWMDDCGVEEMATKIGEKVSEKLIYAELLKGFSEALIEKDELDLSYHTALKIENEKIKNETLEIIYKKLLKSDNLDFSQEVIKNITGDKYTYVIEYGKKAVDMDQLEKAISLINDHLKGRYIDMALGILSDCLLKNKKRAKAIHVAHMISDTRIRNGKIDSLITNVFNSKEKDNISHAIAMVHLVQDKKMQSDLFQFLAIKLKKRNDPRAMDLAKMANQK